MEAVLYKGLKWLIISGFFMDERTDVRCIAGC